LEVLAFPSEGLTTRRCAVQYRARRLSREPSEQALQQTPWSGSADAPALLAVVEFDMAGAPDVDGANVLHGHGIGPQTADPAVGRNAELDHREACLSPLACGGSRWASGLKRPCVTWPLSARRICCVACVHVASVKLTASMLHVAVDVNDHLDVSALHHWISFLAHATRGLTFIAHGSTVAADQHLDLAVFQFTPLDRSAHAALLACDGVERVLLLDAVLHLRLEAVAGVVLARSRRGTCHPASAPSRHRWRRAHVLPANHDVGTLRAFVALIAVQGDGLFVDFDLAAVKANRDQGLDQAPAGP
jgi:hypothetical protein